MDISEPAPQATINDASQTTSNHTPPIVPNDVKQADSSAVESKRKPTDYYFITLDKSATLQHRETLYDQARKLARSGYQTKQVDGRMRITFRVEEQMQMVADKLHEIFGETNIFTATGSVKKPKPKSEVKRWVVAGYESAAIQKLDDSYKLGLAEALADQIGATSRDQIAVEAYYDQVACVVTKTAETARLVDNNGERAARTGLVFRWIRFGTMRTCPNCSGIDCERGRCRNKMRCAYCTGRHLISSCDKKKTRKKCIRCKGKSVPHSSLDKTCPVLLKRIVDNPALVNIASPPIA